jgi:hypothetical protein
MRGQPEVEVADSGEAEHEAWGATWDAAWPRSFRVVGVNAADCDLIDHLTG